MQSLIRRFFGKFFGIDFLGWQRDARRMRELVGAFDTSAQLKSDAVHFAIVLMPWMGTSVPWFCMVTGLFLAASGNKVTFVVDDLPFGGNRLSSRFQLRCVRWVLRALGPHFAIISASDFPSNSQLNVNERDSIERLAALNAIWELRGDMVSEGRKSIIRRSICQLQASYHPIGNVVREGKFDVLFVPGGVWGTSGIWIEHARAVGVRVASFDSGGYGNLLLAVDGIACQLQDIPRAFAMLKLETHEHHHRTFVIESAQKEMARRRAGVDKFSSQIQGSSSVGTRFNGGVLIALNSSWDSAALGLHEVFKNNSEWIVETTRYLLDHTSAPVIIRQHPVERLAIARTSDDYAALLTKHFGAHPRLHFIAADEAVNSYDLLEQVATVVVYTSTIGIEAAAQGKPVITASSSYYSNLGFVRKATSIAQYREYLSDAVAGHFTVSATMRDDALICYYLTQCCNWIFTPFTVPEFHEWVARDLAHLYEEESVKRIVQGLEKNIPSAILNHLARIKQEKLEMQC